MGNWKRIFYYADEKTVGFDETTRIFDDSRWKDELRHQRANIALVDDVDGGSKYIVILIDDSIRYRYCRGMQEAPRLEINNNYDSIRVIDDEVYREGSIII